jgi:hypothetical protein
MTMQWSNNASTTIAGSITPASTTINLAAGTGAEFPSPTGGNYFVATLYDQATKTQYEIVHVTARSGDVVTVTRAQEGTTAQNWNAGDIFANLVTAGTLNQFVQAGTGPADTSVLYVGTDVSTTANLVVCNTNPVPAAYATGMQFNIKIGPNIGGVGGLGKNTGPVNLQFNGLASVAAMRNDGSAMVGGDLINGQECTFVYNGVNFNAIGISSIKQSPPQLTFYVRSSSSSVIDANGLESASGFSNDDTNAFRSIQGAINTIASRYTSTRAITVSVADGTYTTGGNVSGQYIAEWVIVGNKTNPSNCIVDARSTVTGSYVPGGNPGFGFVAGQGGILVISGFTIYSYYSNISCILGLIDASCINYHCPTLAAVSPGSGAVIACGGGQISLNDADGVNTLHGDGLTCGNFIGIDGGDVTLGFSGSIYYSSSFQLTCADTFTVSAGFLQGSEGGTCIVYTNVVSIGGPTIVGRRYISNTGGGVYFTPGNAASIPASQPGYTDPVTYGWVLPQPPGG